MIYYIRNLDILTNDNICHCLYLHFCGFHYFFLEVRIFKYC